MRLFVCVMLAVLAVKVLAEPAPSPANVVNYEVDDEAMDPTGHKDEMRNTQRDASSGRLFLLKHFLFQKMFGQKPSPPIIPIIITRPSPDYTTNIDTPTLTDGTAPTTTGTNSEPPTTNTDPIPTGTPITTNTPTTNPGDPANPSTPNNPMRHFEFYDANEDIVANNQQYLPHAEEYIVAGQNVKHTARAPARLNLRLRGSKRNQIITISLPTKYRGHFHNGQRVVLQHNKATRPAKRRVIRRRKISRRGSSSNNSKKTKRRRYVDI